MKITPIPHVKRFIQDESGVYAVMGGLLALPIVALMFVSLESAGIIQDKARLSDSLEQAVLSLSAENNSGRKSNDYKLADTNANNGHFLSDSDIGKRDLALTKSFVMTYLPQTDAGSIKLEPVCKTEEKTNSQGHTSSAETTCTVSGTIQHKSWFPLKVGSTEVIPTKVDIASASKAIKKNTISIPIDLMVVADLSGSMRYDLENKNETNNHTSKLGILKDVLNELATQSLFNKESNDNNRIAVAPFALGAQYSSTQCILPFVYKKADTQYTFSTGYRSYTKTFRDTIEEYLNGTNSSNSKIKRAIFTQSLAYSIDIANTIESIGEFPNGSTIFSKNKYCLGEANRNDHRWYDKTELKDFSNLVTSLRAEGSTLVSSGLLTAVTKMLKETSRTKELKEETKRVILVLSDGNDELRSDDQGSPFTQYSRITQNLLLGQEEISSKPEEQRTFYDYISNGYGTGYYTLSGTAPIYFKDNQQPRKLSSSLGVCEKIRSKLNQHNDDQNTKIVFVEFGYASKAKEAWLHCVGKENYYSATNRETLLNSFKQAIGHTDDVGHSIN
ncbi:TadE/TadG family type IV pilus assembly protein [Actinobacillus equuli]|uniref:TadE/TadG family type IV pilus assembly protein n=1 Tax=Actinobacillus equuli TaxID=718 RepID=UPI0024466C74|nr:pilus assembly protein [Actinobacillus equuli]WGE84301.1 pilus assembly protein [Actinobacillus equuli subsp. equuli]